MKPAVVLLLAAVCFILGSVATSVAQSPGLSPPPGVAPENWVPISDNAGVALSDNARVSRPRSVRGIQSFATQRHAGILMVHQEGRWIAFDMLGDASPRFQPLN